MKVLITREIPHTALEILSKYTSLTIDYRQSTPLTHQELQDAIKDADAIIPVIPDQLTEDIIVEATKLKVIALYSVGFDNVDLSAATKKGIYVANTPGDLTEAIAEFTLGLMLALSKNIVSADKYVREGKFKYWDPLAFLGPKLAGKTLGIVGMGRIGSYLAVMAHKGLDMKILYADPKKVLEVESKTNAVKVELDTLLGNSDFVSLNCPLTAETHHLIGERELHQMKPTAFLINTARGAVLNEAALYTALKENWICGAALDVFEDEPRLYSGLSELENIIVTPHIASATREARIQMAALAAHNIIDVLIDGKAPRNLVNKELTKNISLLY